MRKLVATACFSLLATTCAADDVTCPKAMTQSDLNTCAEDNYKSADKALNEAWGGLSNTAKTKLRGEERDWIARRDAKCKTTASEAEGGSMYPLLYFSCMAEKTEARTKVLKNAGQ